VNVAKNIVRLRKRRKLTSAQLARLLNRSKSTIHAWEHGGPGPRLDDLPELAQVLDATVEDLVADEAA
jgi:transcriptional regulator with XRE-family HTH domain